MTDVRIAMRHLFAGDEAPALLLDPPDFDEAVFGICERAGGMRVAAYDRSRVVRFDDRHTAHREPRAAAPWTGYSSSLDIQSSSPW